MLSMWAWSGQERLFRSPIIFGYRWCDLGATGQTAARHPGGLRSTLAVRSTSGGWAMVPAISP
jgi:hypothetical protein